MNRRLAPMVFCVGLAPWLACQPPSRNDAHQSLSALSGAEPLGGGDYSYGVGDLGHGVVSGPQPVEKHIALASDLQRISRRKPSTNSGALTYQEIGVTDETIDWASERDPNTSVVFTLLLPSRPFDWSSLRTATGAARKQIIQRRKDDVAPAQADLEARATALGATILDRDWLIHGLHIAAPVGLAPILARLPGVDKLEHSVPMHPNGKANNGYYGGDRRSAVHSDRFISAGFLGSYGYQGSPQTHIRIADIGTNVDAQGLVNPIAIYHPGFATAIGVTRFSNELLCSPSILYSCSPDITTGGSHDHVVMEVLGGSIELGQDPALPGTSTTAQIDRSGICPLASLDYFRQGGDADSFPFELALREAIAKGEDIINVSQGSEKGPGGNVDHNGVNEALQAAFNAGIVIVASAGNSNGINPGDFSTTCNMDYPSNRPEVIAVNGYNSMYDGNGHVQSNPTMFTTAWSTSACNISVYNGSSYVSQPNNAIGAVTPGVVGMLYTDTGYLDAFQVGSSYAAPIVSGVAGLLRDAWYELGYGVRANYWIKTDIMLLSDGWDFNVTNPSDGTQVRTRGTSQFSGPGRLVTRAPVRSFPSGGWQWTWGTYNISNHSVATATFSANVQHLRSAMFWEEADLSHVADIDMSVDALDSTGTVCAYDIAGQSDYSIENVVHLTRNDIPPCALPNGYLRINYVGYAVPSGQTRAIYVSSLVDSEPTY